MHAPVAGEGPARPAFTRPAHDARSLAHRGSGDSPWVRFTVQADRSLSLRKQAPKQETTCNPVVPPYRFNGVEFEVPPGECITIQTGGVRRIEEVEESVIPEVCTRERDGVIRLKHRFGRTGRGGA